MSCLPKPVLRGHVQRRGIKVVLGGLSLAIFNSSLYYFLVKLPKEKAFEEFLKTYDAEAHFKDLVKWGYIQTIKNQDS